MSKQEHDTTLPGEDGHLQEIIAEEEFLRLAQNASIDVLRISLFLEDVKLNPKAFNKKLFYVISSATRDLEDFLDDHGAKNNRSWHLFRELVASARWFGLVAFLVEHIEMSHVGPEERKIFKNYVDETKAAKQYFNHALAHLFKLIREEAKHLKISFPPKGLGEKYYYDIPSNQVLPQNLDEGEGKNERENIVKICSKYVNIALGFEDLECDHRYPLEELSRIVPKMINEERIRRYELRTHNLESVYDTYVRDTSLETSDPRLNRLRTHISITLHLLEIARGLAHFYERHEKINFLLEKAIKNNTALNCTVNWALYHSHHIMRSGSPVAETILREYAAMDSIELPVPRDLGFHLRPSTLVAKVVNHYGSEVYMLVGEDKFEAKSVLSITWAGGKIAREKVEKVTFVGDKRVLDDLKILAGVNYGEDHLGKDRPLPKELAYLR